MVCQMSSRIKVRSFSGWSTDVVRPWSDPNSHARLMRFWANLLSCADGLIFYLDVGLSGRMRVSTVRGPYDFGRIVLL